jgi:hypothetical protein
MEPRHRPYRVDDAEDVPVSVEELAAAVRAQKTRGTRPWWVGAIGQVGVGAVFAYILLTFVTGDMARKQGEILANTTANKAVMAQASKDMGEFRVSDDQWKDLMLMVARQTCRNAVPVNSPTARSDRDACDVLRTQR